MTSPGTAAATWPTLTTSRHSPLFFPDYPRHSISSQPSSSFQTIRKIYPFQPKEINNNKTQRNEINQSITEKGKDNNNQFFSIRVESVPVASELMHYDSPS